MLLWVYQPLIISYAVLCQCTNKLFQRCLETALEQKIPLQTDAVPPRPPKICKRCDKPVNQECQVSRQAHNQERRRPSSSQSSTLTLLNIKFEQLNTKLLIINAYRVIHLIVSRFSRHLDEMAAIN